MAETTADVRRDIELTRERMSDTILELERKLDVGQVVRDHPWPAIGLAAAAGFLLSGSRADVKAAGVAATTVSATKGKASRLGPLLDDLVAKVLAGVNDALQQRADELVEELKSAIGAPGGARHHAAPPPHGAHGAYESQPAGHHAAGMGGAGTGVSHEHTPSYAQAHAEAHQRGYPHDHLTGQPRAGEGFAPGGHMPQPEMRGTEAWSGGSVPRAD